MLSRVRSICRSWLRRERFEEAMAEELRFHLAARVDDLIASGMPRAAAERRARLEFGAVDTAKDGCRQTRGLRLVDEFRQDLRYAWRALVKSPAFTSVAALTLALGIGAVTIIYSVVYNVAVDPLPYKDARRLVNVLVRDDATARVRGVFTIPELLDLRDQTSVFEDVVGTLGQGMRYDTGRSVEFLRAIWVTPNFFDFMGLKPLHGRAFSAADVTPGAEDVAVLRHRAWVAYFGADPRVVGTTILLDGQPRTIIGVMPPRFTWHAADVWIPGPLDRGAANASTTIRNFQARLKPGVTIRQAEAELNVVAARRARAYPKEYPEKFRIEVWNVIEYTVGPFSGVLYTALAAVGLLLVISCCNVANMLLARATTREREMMIRTALGAARGRIVRQLMVESVLLAAAGAALGCLFAYAGIDAIVARLPQSPLPGEVEIALNAPVLLFSLGAAACSALLFGLAPALYAARRELVEGLKSGGKGIAGGKGRLRNSLVVAQIALSLVLVLAAGLLTRTFISVIRVDLGFNPDNLLVVPISVPPGRYGTAAERQRLYTESLERIRSLPGVIGAAATTGLPPLDAGAASALEVPGSTAGTPLAVAVQLCTAEYFATLGIPFTRGDPFANLAVDESPRLAVVNEAFVKHYFGGRDPRGRQITLKPTAGGPDPTRHGTVEIAGSVKDVVNSGLREGVAPQVYLPWSGASRGFPTILVRTEGDPAALLNPIRAELARVDRQVVAVQPRTTTEFLDRFFYAQPRFSLLVMGVFAATGTLLVAVGVFSVMAYTVSRQKKEIAVRMALGATHADVCTVVLRSGTRLLVVGAAVGIAASFATNRLLAAQLWNVSPHDPLTLAAAMIVISAITLIACYVPARRAMRVEPIGALRDD